MTGRFTSGDRRPPDDAPFGPRTPGTSRTSAHGLVEPAFVTRSAAMSDMLEMAAIFARLEVPILLEGESGTGKLYVARYIHFASSRRDGPFQWIHGAALNSSLADSDLFGHRQGAYTGAIRSREGLLAHASGGTVLIDELGKMEAAIQGKLLHVIEGYGVYAVGDDRARNMDVRFLMATSESLEGLAASGRFMPDLLQRVKSFRLRVPALRERREDIPDLVQQFAELTALKAGYFDGPPQFEAGLVRALTRAPWEGNLRELRDSVLKLMAFAQGARTVTLVHCRGDLVYLRNLARGRRKPSRAEVEVALKRSSGNRTRAAEMLEVSRKTVQRRLKERPSDEKREG